MAYPWIKLSTDYLNHPKAVALRDRLEDPRAAHYLPGVWTYVAKWYPVGSIPDSPAAIQALERAAFWQGSDGELVAAMIEVGLLERRRGRILVHDWDEWQGAHREKWERDRARMRAKRAEHRGNGRATVARESHDSPALEERERRGDEEKTEKQLLPSPAAPARSRGSTGKAAADPRHHPLQQLLEATFLELRGTAYGHQGGRDGKAVAELLRLSAGAADEVERRWRRALSLERYPGCASFTLLAHRWNELAATAPRANGAPVPAMAAGNLGQTGGFAR